MMIGLSTLDIVKPLNVTLFTRPLPTPGPANALIRAPFWALVILTFVARTFSTISNTPENSPSEPTDMPWDPVQLKFDTRMLVEFGLKLTQSSPFVMTEFWIFTLSLRYVSQPSVFGLDVEADIVILLKVTFELLSTMLNQFGLSIILIFWISTFFALNVLRRIGLWREELDEKALHHVAP